MDDGVDSHGETHADFSGRATDLQVFHLEDVTAHYAGTLSRWRQYFRANLDGVRRLGCSDAFTRTWEFYFRSCEGGFRERMIGERSTVPGTFPFQDPATLSAEDRVTILSFRRSPASLAPYRVLPVRYDVLGEN